MPRIRTIKPEFWRSPDVMELDYFQRLLFIGLWNLADDEGRGVFSPEAIAADLFLSEYSLNPHGVLTEVSNAFAMYSELDMVQVYIVGRRKFFQIQNWGAHQKINRASDSKFPPPDHGELVVQCVVIDNSVSAHGGLTEDSVKAHDRNREQGTGNMRGEPARKVIHSLWKTIHNTKQPPPLKHPGRQALTRHAPTG